MSGTFTGPKVTYGGGTTYVANWSRQVQVVTWLPSTATPSFWTLTECPISGQLAICTRVQGSFSDLNYWSSHWQKFGWVLDSTVPDGTYFDLVTYSTTPIDMNRLVSPVDRRAFPVQPTIQIGF